MVTAHDVKQALLANVEPGRKQKNEWFFKGGAGHYSEGDQFIGVRVPAIRALAADCRELPYNEVKALFGSPVHEHRLAGAIILTYQYTNLTAQGIYDFYIEQVLHNTTLQIEPDYKVYGPRRGIDNWDIVDVSAHKIIGKYLADKKNRNILYDLAEHQGLWQNRVAMVSTWWLINKRGEFSECLALSEKFLTHKHDLMHKASGWMLREMGKQDPAVLVSFLDKYADRMPRTMLRYAIERLPEGSRKTYLSA